MSTSIGSTASSQQFDPSQMRAKMQEGLAKLKQSDPTLANKLDQIDKKMQDLQKSGTDPKAAMDQIKQQFGELSSQEQSEIKSAMGEAGGGKGFGPIHGQRPPQAPTASSSSSSESSLWDSIESSSSTSKKSTSTATSSSQDSALQQLMALVAKNYGASAKNSATSSLFGSQGLTA